MKMRYVVILNEDAGKMGKTAEGGSPDELRAAFAVAGVDADIHTPDTDGLDAVLRMAVAQRPDAVIIGGGDGTVRSAAAVLADTGIPLGVLPLGTYNHFAKDLKLPVDVKETVAVLAAGATRDVDLGEVNGHVFINNCSIGAYAEAVRRRDGLRSRRGLSKWWAMCRASFEEFRRLRRLRLRISTEQGAESPEVGQVVPKRRDNEATRRTTPRPARMVRTPLVVVGNNRYSGHLFSRNLRPHLDEGRLWLYTVRARRHLSVLRMMMQSLVGKLDEADALDAEPATEITIESDSGAVPVAADGELLTIKAPFHFRVRPAALRVLAPVEETTDNGRETAEDGDPKAHDRSAVTRAGITQLSAFRLQPSR